MKKIMMCLTMAAVLFLIGLIGGQAMAANVSTQTVTYAVDAINEFNVSGDPGTLTINTAVAGSPPTSVEDSTTTYAITTNQTGRIITGAINTAMPAGVTLTVALAAPTGGSGGTDVTLTGTAATLVTGITTLNESGLAITYKLSATSAAGVVSSANKTVTFTIAAGS